MTSLEVVRERQVWIAVTAVLVTSLAWLAVVSLALAAGTQPARLAAALAMLRALSHVAVALGRSSPMTVLGALGVAGLLLPLAMHAEPGAERRTRHG